MENETLKNILSQYRAQINNSTAEPSFSYNNTSKFVHKIFEIIKTKNKNPMGHIAEYDKELKQFATYLYAIGGKFTYETLVANLFLPSVSTVKKEIQSSNGPIIEGTLRVEALSAFLNKRKLPLKVWLSEDATKIVNKIEYDSTTDQIVGLVLPMDSSGIPIPFSFTAENVSKMQHSLLNYPKANDVYTVMSRSLNVNAPAFCLSLFGTDNKFTTGQVLKRWAVTEKACENENITPLGWSSDGDSRCLRAMRIRSGLVYNPLNVPVKWKEWFNATYMPKLNCVQDTHHICAKLKNRLYDSTAVMVMGKYIVSKSHLSILIDSVTKDKHLLVPSDIRPLDKMNFKPVVKIMDPIVRTNLKENVAASLGTSIYLGLIENVYKSYMDEDLKPLQRIYRLWYTIFFLRIWRIWLTEHPKLDVKNFITYNTYACIELNGHSLINTILSLAATGEDDQFVTTLMGSQTCEEMFRRLRSLTTMNWTSINFTLLEILHKIKRIEFSEEAMADLNTSFNFPRLNTEKHTSYKLPSEDEIFDMVTEAKVAALKDTAEIGIILDKKGNARKKGRKNVERKTPLSCQLSSIIVKADERESSSENYFEDEDSYPSDCDGEDELYEEEKQPQEQGREQTKQKESEPEDISSILQSHGGSINLKEFTNVKGKIFSSMLTYFRFYY